MSAAFVVKELSPDKIAQAYTLVQAAHANVSFDEWLAFAGARLGAERGSGEAAQGIVVVEDAQGYLHGLFCYHVTEDSLRGRTLVCDHLTLTNLLGLLRPLSSLIEAAETLVRRHRCQGVNLCLPKALLAPSSFESDLHDALQGAGHEMDSLRFHKPFGTRL